MFKHSDATSYDPLKGKKCPQCPWSKCGAALIGEENKAEKRDE